MIHKQPEKTRVSLEDKALTLTDMHVGFDQEGFVFLPISGAYAVQYHLGPAHAKRISLILAKSIASYEKEYGRIETLMKVRSSAEKSNASIHSE